jgi:hypothetical protein
MAEQPLIDALDRILRAYSRSFRDKAFGTDNKDHDILMDVFGITPIIKAENKQYWGRELGMCWEGLLQSIFRTTDNYKEPYRIGADSPFDFIFKDRAVDTKYRIGSGDSGTLKKFRANGLLLSEKGFKPTLLILRNDNLYAAIQAYQSGGWDIRVGDACFKFIKESTGIDIVDYLNQRKLAFAIGR